MTPVTCFPFTAAVIMLYGPVRRLSRALNSVQQTTSSVERVFEIIDQPPAITDRPNAVTLTGFGREIGFENIGFRYPGSDDLVLKEISLTVRKGEVLALVGMSGAGKSTLMDLLPRFHDVTTGRIVIDGHDLRDVTQASLRAQIGLVTQDTFLFKDTIHYNIAYGRPDAAVADVVRPARAGVSSRFSPLQMEGGPAQPARVQTAGSAGPPEPGGGFTEGGQTPPPSLDLAEAVDDRQTPVTPEGPRGDLDADGSLAPLVLVAVDHADDLAHRLRVEAQGDDVGDPPVLLHVSLENGVQPGVGRQRVLVRLVRAQLRGRWAGEDALGDQVTAGPLVDVAGDLVDQRLRHVLDHGEAAGHVAVERRIADAVFALVSGGEYEPAELVRERHEQRPPDARLDVLLGRVLPEPLEGPGQRARVGADDVTDRQGEELDPQILAYSSGGATDASGRVR